MNSLEEIHGIRICSDKVFRLRKVNDNFCDKKSCTAAMKWCTTFTIEILFKCLVMNLSKDNFMNDYKNCLSIVGS